MNISQAKTKRRYLFLQGPPSKFWLRLGDALIANGYYVDKVNFSLADRCFWGLRPGTVFRKRFTEWPTALGRMIEQKMITDIVYYNDGFPYHQAAIKLAKTYGVRSWCVEFGYLRPDWITLEPNGMNEISEFPELPEDIKRIAAFGTAPDFDLKYPHKFATEATAEVVFNILQTFGRPYNPWFCRDNKAFPLFEYLGWLPNLIKFRQDQCKANALIDHLKQGKSEFFLAAMQMEGDYQVRSSRFGNMEVFLDEVLQSFAESAAATSRLIVKAHPLESGLHKWEDRVKQRAKQFDLTDRVDFLRGGELETVLRHVKGLVVINSTTGLHALRCGTPVIALGKAIYNRDGLTHGDDLTSFWRNPKPVDQVEFSEFLKALSVIQVRGSFYNKVGQQHAIEEIVSRLTAVGPNSVHALLLQ